MSRNQVMPDEPRGELVIRTIALPKDTNSYGDVFGGWLLAQMDLGGGIMSKEIAHGRITTVAIEGMRFWNTVHVGDTVCVHSELIKIGRTSITLNINVWATPLERDKRRCVTQALFTYVALDENRRPIPVKRRVND